MRKDVVAMVLVGGRGTRLGPITKYKAKPAVTFGGKYKLIDFVLSNLSHAFIDTVGIVTQYEPHALMDYIQRGSSWDLDVSDGGIHFLTPYTSFEGDKWQKGTAHAVAQHIRFIDMYKPKHVLILSGDHVYKMQYEKLIHTHEESDADVTIAVFKPHDDLSRYGVLDLDQNNHIIDFEEKPDNPKSDYASMGIYVFKTRVLNEMLGNNFNHANDFGKNIIPKALAENYHVHGYVFNDYFRDVGTIQSLYDANMDLLDHPEYLKLHDYKTQPLYTKTENLPPHHNMASDAVTNALISDGVLIMGRVHHSVLSSNVTIKAHAFVQDSVIFSNVTVGEHSEIKNCIVLEGTYILPRTKLVFDDVTVIDNETLWAMGGKRS